MNGILDQEQEALFGNAGSMLEELHADVARLIVAVARNDRTEAADALAMLREDVESLAAGLAMTA